MAGSLQLMPAERIALAGTPQIVSVVLIGVLGALGSSLGGGHLFFREPCLLATSAAAG